MSFHGSPPGASDAGNTTGTSLKQTGSEAQELVQPRAVRRRHERTVALRSTLPQDKNQPTVYACAGQGHMIEKAFGLSMLIENTPESITYWIFYI